MFGLHQASINYLAWSPVIAVGLVLSLIAFYKAHRTFVKYMSLGSAVFSLLGLIAIVSDGFRLEEAFDRRDTKIVTQLSEHNIHVVDFPDDRHAVVKSDECFAAYVIQDFYMLGLNAWPLIEGSGQPLMGCKSKDIDELFIRQV